MKRLILAILLIACPAWALDIDEDNNNMVDEKYGGVNRDVSDDVSTLLGSADNAAIRTNIGAEAVGVAAGLDHTAVTLDADAAVVFDLSTQEIGLDVQTANTVFAGPTTGAANEPTFRALVAGDIPNISATYQPLDADLTTASSATGSGNSKYFGTSGAGVVGFHDVPTASASVADGDAVGDLLQWDGNSWEPVSSLGSIEIGGMTASMAVHSTPSGILASHDTVSSTELGRLNGLTEDLTTSLAARTTIGAEIDGKDNTPHLTVAQMKSSNCIVTNLGQADADIIIGLPTIEAGLSCLFTVATARAKHWGVHADTNDAFYIIADDGTVSSKGTDAASVVLVAAQLGQSFAVWSQKTGTGAWDWFAKPIAVGTSTFAAHAAP